MIERLRILLVDEDAATRRTLAAHLARSGDDVDLAEDGRAAQSLLTSRTYDLVLGDVRSPRVDVASLAEAVRLRSPDAAVVPMSAFASVEHVTAAIRVGVYDYLLKPVEPQHIAVLLCRVRERIAMRRRLDALRETLPVRDALAVLMSGGPTMASVNQSARRAAACDDPVLLVGESGTGRGLVARAIHALSARAEMPLVMVDCAHDPARLGVALFGTPLSAGGHLADARGGTLVLDEVTAMPADLRARVFAAVTQPGAPRVIAVSTGIPTFTGRRDPRRTELLSWVRGIEIVTPPLRERREDIPRLVEYYAQLASGIAAPVPRVAPEVMAAFIESPWEGNLRELEAVVREAVTRAGTSGVITREHLPESVANRVDRGSSLVEQVEAYERAVVRRALETASGAVARAARELGVPERTLRRKMRHFGIAKEAFRKRSRYKHLPVSVPRA